VSDYFPGYKIINRGFGGSSMTDVFRYSYDIIIPCKPKQVVIYYGENDLAKPDSPAALEIFLRCTRLFGIIRTNLAEMRISFVFIKPSPVRAHIQTKVQAANKGIKAFI